MFTGEPEPPKEVPVKTTYEKKPKTEKPPETPLEKLIRQAQRKPRTIPFKDRKQLDPETQKKVDAVTPPFATKQGETGPLPVSMRNRRVPKTSSLSPNVNVTSVVKPTVGPLPPVTEPVIKPEVFNEPRQRTRGGRIGQDTGRVVDTTATEVKPERLGPPPEIHAYIPPDDRRTGETTKD